MAASVLGFGRPGSLVSSTSPAHVFKIGNKRPPAAIGRDRGGDADREDGTVNLGRFVTLLAEMALGDDVIAMYVVCRALIVDETGRNPRSRWSFRHLVSISDQFAMPAAKAFRKRPGSSG